MSDAGGAGVYEVGREFADVAVLRERASTLEAIAKAAAGRRVVATDADHSLAELQRLAKNLSRARARDASVLSVLDSPGAAEALELGGAHVWRVRGAEGSLFASAGAPPYADRIEPVSTQGDFAKPPTRALRLLKVSKAAGEPSEALPEKQIVYGIVLEPEVYDSQEDIYSADEIENAAHLYLENFQQIGHMHQTMLPGESVRIVESYIAPCDFTMGGEAVKAGAWVVAVHCLNDDLWAQVKNGELTGFSIGGWAQRVPVATENADGT